MSDELNTEQQQRFDEWRQSLADEHFHALNVEWQRLHAEQSVPLTEAAVPPREVQVLIKVVEVERRLPNISLNLDSFLFYGAVWACIEALVLVVRRLS